MFMHDEANDCSFMHPSPFQQYSCGYSVNARAAQMSGSIQIAQGSESDLITAVAYVGPVSVAVDASSNAFRVSRNDTPQLYIYVSVGMISPLPLSLTLFLSASSTTLQVCMTPLGAVALLAASTMPCWSLAMERTRTKSIG